MNEEQIAQMKASIKKSVSKMTDEQKKQYAYRTPLYVKEHADASRLNSTERQKSSFRTKENIFSKKKEN